MIRTATFRWRTPAPTSIDEELALYDDGRVLLVARRGMADRAAVGTWMTTASADEAAALAGVNLGIDALEPVASDGPAAVATALASRAREHPLAVARFYAGAVSAGVGLAVVGEGDQPVRFELDEGSVGVVFEGPSGVVRTGVGSPATGFVTEDVLVLGGVGNRAAVPPGEMGSLLLPAQVPSGTTSLSVDLEGWLVGAFPDVTEPQPFSVRTEPAAVAAAG